MLLPVRLVTKGELWGLLQQCIYRPQVLPVAQPTASKHKYYKILTVDKNISTKMQQRNNVLHILSAKLLMLATPTSETGCCGASSIASFFTLETQWIDCSHYIKWQTKSKQSTLPKIILKNISSPSNYLLVQIDTISKKIHLKTSPRSARAI